jgi:2-methylfumaryl-CoA hydratase
VTWETTSYDADTDEELCGYRRTNMIPRREPTPGAGEEGAGDAGTGGGDSTTDQSAGDDTDDQSAAADTTDQSESATSESEEPTRTGTDATGDRPPFAVPEGPYFEDFRDALDRADAANRTVAYRHERGRTMDDTLVSVLPLRTLNTARQHHDANAMADSPSGDVVAYGDVTRSIALGHARSDEATYRELGYRDETFHEFVTLGDTVYAFTRVLDATEGGAFPAEGAGVGDTAGVVEFEHVAVNQHDRPVYSGRRTAAIRRRDS